MRSVSMSSPRTNTPRPVTCVILSNDIVKSLIGGKYLPCVGDFPGNRCRGDHQRAHQNGTARWTSLAALKIPVAGACAELIADQLVRVHSEAHRASGASPFKARVAEDCRQPHFLRDLRYALGPRYDYGFDSRLNLAALQMAGDLGKIAEAAIGAASRKATSTLVPLIGFPDFRCM